jgi:hypothetical protein
MGDFMSRFADAWRNAPPSPSVRRAFSNGFDDAADICIGVVSGRTDAVLSQIKQGNMPASHGNLIVATLAELRSEMEAELRGYWVSDDQGH